MARVPSNVVRHAPAKWSIRFQSLISMVVISSMLLLTAALVWNSWQSAKSALLQATQQKFKDLGALINEKSRRMLEPAEASLGQLSFDPIAESSSVAQRFQRLPALTNLLQGNKLLSAVYIGYPNGDFFLVRRLDTPELRQLFDAPGAARWLVQTIESTPGTAQRSANKRGQWHYLDAQLKTIRAPFLDDYRFDPRERAWFKSATQTGVTTFTQPYVFFSSRQVGVTLSARSRIGTGTFGLDVDISSLQEEMAALRYTPNTQLAVVDDQQRVIATPNTHNAFQQQGDAVELRTLSELGLTPLARLVAASPVSTRSMVYEAGDAPWYGMRIPLQTLSGHPLEILIGIPDEELLGQLRKDLRHQVYQGLLIALLLLPLGWLAGRRIGRTVQRLSAQGRGFARFRFDSPLGHRTSYLREVQELDGVLQQMGRTVQNFLGITETISRETQTSAMLNKVLDRLLETTQSEHGAVYLCEAGQPSLTRAAHADRGSTVSALNALPAQLSVDEGLAWAEKPGALTHLPGGTHARLALRLNDHRQQLLGLVVLQFKDEELHASRDFLTFVEKLSGALEVSIETRNLIDSQRRLLEGVIQLLADAIDAKSPYTGGHCERVPELAEMFIERLNTDPNSPYAGRWTPEKLYEFKLGAWLHDCGKVTSPEYIIDKATKLETIYNRIHEVRTRFEVLHRDAWVAYWRGLAEGGKEDVLRALRDQRLQELQDDFAFVARCNIGSESMDEKDIERLHALGRQTWDRHFDDRQGISQEEADRLRQIPSSALPSREYLLSDRPEHVRAWGDRKPPVEKDDPLNFWGFDMQVPAHERHLGELHNLSVKRGTLTAEERFKVNEHIVQTLIMLRSLPWPPQLARVPEIAATHHEQLNGQGYPRKLTAEQLTVEDRIMAIVDIFEALTAADRPYKTPKSLSESLNIMTVMAQRQHICPDMFRYFLRSGLWRDFASAHIHPAQIDSVNIDLLEASLSPPVSAPAH